MVALKYAARYSGMTSFILTKLDVLSGFDEIKIAVGYEIHGKKVEDFPYDILDIQDAKPIYKTLPGWKEEIRGVTSIDKLPTNARKYVDYIRELLNIPLVMLSTGAGRGESIEAYNPFEG
jgi:adenylosuccinate synthase